MDTSKEYIKMCEKAKEIQKEWIPHTGDWFLDKSTLLLEIKVFGGWYVLREGGFIERVGDSDNYDFEDKGKVEIWLPRQDQLQEMMKDIAFTTHEGSTSYWLIVKLHTYCINLNRPIHESMEQLWLAFVIWELYDKKWDGTKWTK